MIDKEFDMEMPKYCYECFFCKDGWCVLEDECVSDWRPYWCPLRENDQKHEELKRGRWDVVLDRDGYQMEDEWFGRIFKCNICGHKEMEGDEIRFCAGCGAKMNGFGRDDKGAGGDVVDGA